MLLDRLTLAGPSPRVTPAGRPESAKPDAAARDIELQQTFWLEGPSCEVLPLRSSRS